MRNKIIIQQGKLRKGNLGSNTYSLYTDKTVSIGVYDVDDTLLRTLVSGEEKTAGIYQVPAWDGNDDFGNDVSSQGVKYKVLANAVQYIWKGVKIGNTSTNLTGPNRHAGLTGFNHIRSVGDKVYFAKRDYEQRQPFGYFDKTTPNVSHGLLGKAAAVTLIADDYTNNTVYFAGYDYGYDPKVSYVFALNYDDNLEKTFSSGEAYTVRYSMTYASIISKVTSNDGVIYGLTCSNNHLYVARRELDEIQVLNKTTGALVTTITTFSHPTKMEWDGTYLWVNSDAGLEKYSVNGDGSLSGLLLNINTLNYVYDISIHGSNIYVCDGGTSQQIRNFALSDGTEGTPFGTLGGYNNAPLVSNDKFFFSNPLLEADFYHQLRGGITHNSDGSYWVLDILNNRLQKYNSSNVFQDRVQFIPTARTSTVDSNDPTRLFASWMEFSVDYSQPDLAPTQTHNWEYNVPDAFNHEYNSFTQVRTYGNGRTYALLFDNVNERHYFFEMTSTGVRNTGVYVSGLFLSLTNDGKVLIPPYGYGYTGDGGETATYQTVEVVSFDGSNNPVLGSPVSFATYDVTKTVPVFRGDRQGSNIIDSNLIVFDPTIKNATSNMGSGHHLGALKPDGNWKWKTQKSIESSPSYIGVDDYPQNGDFESGGGSNNNGSKAMIVGDHIFTGHYMEFYKELLQANQYTHFYKNGLLLKVFGVNWTSNPDTANSSYYLGNNGYWRVYEPFAEMDGNALHPFIVQDPTNANKLHLFYTGEGWHSGLGRYEITGLDTIEEFIIPIN